MILLTGAAGFIGFHTAHALAQAGCDIVGVDNINSYYSPALKRARLAALAGLSRFRFHEVDIAEPGALQAAAPAADVEGIVHLAAQAGVRHSLDDPFVYERSNVAGHLAVLEYARRAPKLRHLVYASSSSVYGDRPQGPFHEDDRVDAPASLYAATKRACELMSESYARLFAIPQTGLRFFTVYGPWGRPDMAYFSFTEKILRGEEIILHGEGRLARDFTYIADVAPTILRALDRPPTGAPPHALYNIGNSRPVTVTALVEAIEAATGRTALRRLGPAQKGDVTVTYADIGKAAAAFGYAPRTTIQEGVPAFVDWHRRWAPAVGGGV